MIRLPRRLKLLAVGVWAGWTLLAAGAGFAVGYLL